MGTNDAGSHLIAAMAAATAEGSQHFHAAIRGLLLLPVAEVDKVVQDVFDNAIEALRTNGWRRPEWEQACARLLGDEYADIVRTGSIPPPLELRQRALQQAVILLACLADLGASPSTGRGRGDRQGIDERILTKVRGLLAKAESTEFPDEAEALSEKAQELMSRYAIDRALVDDVDTGNVETRRIVIDDPYARPKSILLSRVARANRCQAMYSPQVGLSMVVGFSEHLDACELLYTSLLVQAHAAMMAGRGPGASPRTRSRAFRQSFLVAFADRIGERLDSAREQAESAATEEHGPSVLPVLARQSAAVEDAFERAFPHRRRMTVSINDAEGFAAGRQAADNADLLGVEMLTR